MRLLPALRGSFAVAVVVSTAATGQVAAHHEDFSLRLRVRDNNTQDYDHHNLTAGGELACNHGAAQLARSEISVEVGPDDIHCYDSHVYAGAAGTVEWNNRCDHYRVWFNTSGTDTTPDTFLERNYWRALGCHEFGHTGSIPHVSGRSCMQPGLATHHYNFQFLTQHDLDHINEAL